MERRRRAGAVTEFAKTIEDLARRVETALTDADEQGSQTAAPVTEQLQRAWTDLVGPDCVAQHTRFAAEAR